MQDTLTAKPIAETESSASAAHWSDWWELTKPRLSLMSVATAILGYFAAGPALDMMLFAALALGTTLAAFGCGVLNQWWERDADARMARTADRPIAAGRISPLAGLIYGTALAVAGVLLLVMGVNLAASLLTALIVVLYLFAYTPLKRLTPWATELGAIPGALPPLVGWVAAGAGFSAMGWVLFAILFAWQIPHFMAISWMCREDYARGGFRMLANERDGARRVALKGLLWTLLLVGLSLLPLMDEQLGWPLLLVALFLAVLLLLPAVRFVRQPGSLEQARKLFFATLVFLPLYLGALVVDRFFI